MFKKIFLLFFTILNSFSFSQTKEEFLNMGLKQESYKNYEQAIEFYNKSLAIDPMLIAGYVNRGNSYFELKEYSKALTDANKVLEIDPNFAIALNNRGMIYKEQKKYIEAIFDYNKAINIDKKYFMAYANKVRALVLLNKDDEAKLVITNLKKDYPKDVIGNLVGYVYYSAKNDIPSALNELNLIVDFNINTEIAVFERAQIKDNIGDEKGAIADYNMLIAINPLPKYYYGRCSSNYDLKEYEKVIEDCNNAIKLDDSYYSAYVMLGDVYDTYGKADKSTANYEKAIRINPNLESGYNELGKVYYLKTEYTKALEVFNRFLDRKPNTISTLEYRSGCKSKLLDYKGAIEDYNKLISLNAKDYKYYLLRGQAEKELKNTVDACKDMKKAKSLIKDRLSEEYVSAHGFLFENCRSSFNSKLLKVNDLYNEIRQLYEINKLDLAILKHDEAIKIIPDSSYLYFDRGKTKRQLERHEDAILDYKKAVQLDKKNVEAWTAMGISYMFIMKPEDAILAFKGAIKADESYAMAYHDLALIYSERKQYNEVIKNEEIAVRLDPKYTKAYFILGEAYLNIKNKERACYNFKIADALGSIPAKVKLISECN
jgi:tetratricopeptide (TPR) repeat protein